MTKPSAAKALFPHLKSSDQAPKEQQRAQSLSAAMYPSFSPQAKARDEARERDRQSLLKGLRELNAKIDARLSERRR